MKPLKNTGEIKHYIIESTNSDDLIYTGRAATALLIAFNAIIKNVNTVKPEIILPATSCTTPANTALMAGLLPRFADINLEDGLCTLQFIQQRYNENTVAIVFIHGFGNTQDLIPLRKWCNEKNLILIEDIAQALGAFLPCGNPVGFYGDFSVYSFNPTKLIETGGGALLIKNSAFKKDCHIAFKYLLSLYLDVSAKKKQTLALSYKNLHQGLSLLDRIHAAPKIDSFFLSLQKSYEPLYVLNFTQNEKFAQEWNKIDNYNLNRIEKAETYYSVFNNYKSIKIISDYQQSKVCWRYCILIEDENKLGVLSDKIRQDGFHVSNLYWPVNYFFKADDICLNAYTFARRIINLWVDNSVDEFYVKNCAKSLIKHIEEY